MPATATPAVLRLRRDGIVHALREYRPPERHGRARDDRPEYGVEAAVALGVEPARVCKTLIAAVDGRLVAAVLPVDRQLDLKALAAAAGGRHAELVAPADAERASGSVVGGISPIASRRAMAVVVDRAIEAHPTILVSAGRRGLQLELAPADLVHVTGASIAPIVRPR